MDFSQPFEDENRKRPNIQLQLLQRLKLGRTSRKRGGGGDVLFAQGSRHETRLLIKFTKNTKVERETTVKTKGNIWLIIIRKLRIIVH